MKNLLGLFQLVICLSVFQVGSTENGRGCSSVDLKNLRYQTSRRGRYARTGRQCDGETDGRYVYKQNGKGGAYMYFLKEENGWTGWQVGSSACKNLAGVAARDNATSPEAVTAVWEEFYYMGWWVENENIRVSCAGGLTTWGIIGIVIGSLVAFSIVVSVSMSFYRTYRQRKHQGSSSTRPVEDGELPPPTVYTNEGADLSEDYMNPTMPPGFLATLPDYEDCTADAPPAYDAIYSTNVSNPAIIPDPDTTTTASSTTTAVYDNATENGDYNVIGSSSQEENGDSHTANTVEEPTPPVYFIPEPEPEPNTESPVYNTIEDPPMYESVAPASDSHLRLEGDSQVEIDI